jgi:mesencephalic astrocyte-derived neurotrophic factor
MRNSINLYLAFAVVALAGVTVALREGECEVCVKVIEKFSSKLDEATKKDPKKIETEFRAFCKTSKNKENRFVSLENS